MFAAMAQGVMLEAPLSGQPAVDGRAVLSALEAGRTFSIVHALARPAALEFTASSGSGEVATMGGRLEGVGAPVVFRAAVPQAPGVRIVLIHRGQTVASGRGRVEFSGPSSPGAYRVEAEFPNAAVPWIVSNPIYIGARPQAVPAERELPRSQVVVLAADDRWTVERDGQSTAAVTIADDGLEFEFGLGGGAASGQYAAMVAPVESDEGFDRVRFTAIADRPMRLSLQLRLPGGQDGLRWRKSVYVDDQPATITVRVEDLEPVGGTSSQQPIVARIRSILFVVDTVNTLPGTDGSIRISDVELGVGDVAGESGASF
jgi:hypothetical protein